MGMGISATKLLINKETNLQPYNRQTVSIQVSITVGINQTKGISNHFSLKQKWKSNVASPLNGLGPQIITSSVSGNSSGLFLPPMNNGSQSSQTPNNQQND